MKELHIEMHSMHSMHSNDNYQTALKILRDYTDYNLKKNYELARYTDELIKRVEALHIENPDQPDLTTALGKTYSFFKKNISADQYKNCANTMQGSASPRLLKLSIALVGVAFLAFLAGTVFLMLLASFPPASVGAGILLGLGVGGCSGGSLVFFSGIIVGNVSEASGVSATMEKIANSAVKNSGKSSSSIINKLK